MFPSEDFFSQTVKGQFLNPWVREPFISRHWGPVAIQDPSEGLLVRLWQARNQRDGIIRVSAPGVDEVEWYDHGVVIHELSFAFDQNANPVVVWQDENGDSWLRWFDPIEAAYVVDAANYAITPRVTLDDARPFNIIDSDVIMGYVREGLVRYRSQRERYLIEHTPLYNGAPAPATALKHISMTSAMRVEFLTDQAGDEPWTLAEVVADLLRRSNFKDEHTDVSRLYDKIVDGYRVANEAGADANIVPLMQAWFFDPGEWDKRLRFIPRGGAATVELVFADLLERESDSGMVGPMKITRAQELELLRKVNVSMVDSTAGWVPTKQTAERRSATVASVGESSVVLPITAHPDFTATVAVKRLRIPWGELHKFEYGLGVEWSMLTPTDVLAYTDSRGRKHIMRVAQINEDYGSLRFETNSNATWIYAQQGLGTFTRPSIPTVPGQAGDTVVIPMNIAVTRDQDDELGYYVAVYGTGDGWGGGRVQVSMDGGLTILETLTVDVPATVGVTDSALLAEISGEYLSSQVLRVVIGSTPESIDRDQVLRYRNMAAVRRADGSWEMLQWQTATQVSVGVYDLSGLVRGRYATEPVGIPSGATFVVLDNAVLFLQVQQWMVGQTVSYRGISNRQNADDVAWSSFLVTDPKSQEEWPAHGVRMTGRTTDGLEIVSSMSWIPRPRLGVEVSPRNSKYFQGWKVQRKHNTGAWEDYATLGPNETSTQIRWPGTSLPPIWYGRVVAVNSITGDGQPSDEVRL